MSELPIERPYDLRLTPEEARAGFKAVAGLERVLRNLHSQALADSKDTDDKDTLQNLEALSATIEEELGQVDVFNGLVIKN